MKTGKWSGGLAGLMLCCAMAGGAYAQEDKVVYHVNDAANATAAMPAAAAETRDLMFFFSSARIIPARS